MYVYDVRAHNIDIETEIFQQILRCCNSRMSSTRSEVQLHVQCIRRAIYGLESDVIYGDILLHIALWVWSCF